MTRPDFRPGGRPADTPSMTPLLKPGWKTTEFWLSLAASVWAIFGHALPPLVQGVVVAVATGAYGVGRAVTKASAARTP